MNDETLNHFFHVEGLGLLRINALIDLDCVFVHVAPGDGTNMLYQMIFRNWMDYVIMSCILYTIDIYRLYMYYILYLYE